MTILLIVAICLLVILLSVEVITCTLWPLWAAIIVLSIICKMIKKVKEGPKK